MIRKALVLFVTLASSQVFSQAAQLCAIADEKGESISIFREGDDSKALLTQNAKPDHRPYLHPVMAPDGKGVLTEYSPGHHKHQTGLYWGFTRVNGRDYFHHPSDGYWKRKSVSVLQPEGGKVEWQTIYDLIVDVLDRNAFPGRLGGMYQPAEHRQRGRSPVGSRHHDLGRDPIVLGQEHLQFPAKIREHPIEFPIDLRHAFRPGGAAVIGRAGRETRRRSGGVLTVVRIDQSANGDFVLFDTHARLPRKWRRPTIPPEREVMQLGA